MALDVTITRAADHLVCTIRGEFSPKAGEQAFHTVLAACSQGASTALVDARAISQPAYATEKLLWAYAAERALEEYAQAHGDLPRIAVVGRPPFITPYKPASDHLQLAGRPVKMFDDIEQAQAWLAEGPGAFA
jgi:hypothetical protein